MTLYSTTGGRSYAFPLAHGYDSPLAWSQDSRYLAIGVTGPDETSVAGDGLAVIDTNTMSVATIAHGVIDGASFQPAASDRIVFGSAMSRRFNARVNLYTIDPSGAHPRNA